MTDREYWDVVHRKHGPTIRHLKPAKVDKEFIWVSVVPGSLAPVAIRTTFRSQQEAEDSLKYVRGVIIERPRE